MTTIGADGYISATKKIHGQPRSSKKGCATSLNCTFLPSRSLWSRIASELINVYKVLDYMSRKKWILNGLPKPTCVHQAADECVKQHPAEKKTIAPGYGMAATLPFMGWSMTC
jgi:hypothetical protein